MKKLTTKEFIENAKTVHGDKYDYSLVEYIKDKVKVVIICPEHGKFEQRASAHMGNQAQGCPTCKTMNRRNGLKYFLNKAKEVHGDKFDYSLIIEYKTARTKVPVICKEHGEFLVTPYHHINRSQSCPECKKLGLKNFIIKTNKVHNTKYDYSTIKEYKNNKEKVPIICPIHGEFNCRIADHINGGHGCPKCTLDIVRKDIKIFISEANKIHNNKYNYTKVEYINNKTKVNIKCPIHGYFNQRPDQHLFSKQGCPICNESHGEREIRKLLEEENINFISQYKFSDCKNKLPLSFDFYLPHLNTCIEFNGKQHYEPIKYFGGKDTFKTQKIRDEIKKKYCDKNNIKLVIIKYNESVSLKLLNYFSG